MPVNNLELYFDGVKQGLKQSEILMELQDLPNIGH